MFAVWLLPDMEDTKYLSGIIKNLSQRYDAPEFLPHITVYGLVDPSLEVLEECVRNSISDSKPFIVKKAGIDYSDDIWKTIFVNIEPNSNLNTINEELASKLGQYTKYEFVPHISLIYKKIEDVEKKEIIDSLKIKNEFIIDGIAIQKFSENVYEWKIIRTYSF